MTIYAMTTLVKELCGLGRPVFPELLYPALLINMFGEICSKVTAEEVKI